MMILKTSKQLTLRKSKRMNETPSLRNITQSVGKGYAITLMGNQLNLYNQPTGLKKGRPMIR